jgi:hypothetical protein
MTRAWTGVRDTSKTPSGNLTLSRTPVNYRVALAIRVPGRIGSSARQLTCHRARTTFFSTPMVRTLMLATPLESVHR